MDNSEDLARIHDGVYHLDPIVISDVAPKLSGGWSVGEGPHRGTSNPSKITQQQKSARHLFLEEMYNFTIANQNEYKEKLEKLPNVLESEIEPLLEQIRNNRQLSEYDAAKQEIALLHSKIREQQAVYTAKLKVALSFYGQNPLYLIRELPARKVTDIIKENTANLPAKIQASFIDWNTTIAAAQDLKLSAKSVEFLSRKLDTVSHRMKRIESTHHSATPPTTHTVSTGRQLLEHERNVYQWQLPTFMSIQINQAVDNEKHFSQSQNLQHIKATADRLRNQHTAAVGFFSSANPNIKTPLSRPELEALNDLVAAQRANRLGQRWADYHRSLLHSESARHLTRFSDSLNILHERSKHLEAQQQKILARDQAEAATQNAQRQAEQQALAEAQRKAEDEALERARQAIERDENKTRADIKANATLTAIFAVPKATFATQSATAALEKAIHAGKQAFVRSASRALIKNPAMLAMLYSPYVADGEQPSLVFGTPLSELNLPSNLDLEYVASVKGTIDVPHRMVVEGIGENSAPKWVVADGVKVGTKVRVRSLTYNAKNNTYEFTRDGDTAPSLVWTPIVRPGTSSTTSPGTPPVLPADPGTSIAPVVPELETYPEVVSNDPDDYILKGPDGSELPDTYVLFKDPRTVPGIATGYGEPVTGNWLGDATRSEGAPIPSHIADQLRGEIFSSFDKQREAIWKAVAKDRELSRQFSQSNLDRMRDGTAPYPRKEDKAGGRDKFEIHHKHEVAKGGEVYDMDNIVIMTPKQHIAHHGKKANEL